MTLWLLLSVALPAILAFIGTRWQQGWITVIAILLAAVLIWLSFSRLAAPPESTGAPSQDLTRLMSLMFGAAGATFGVLLGWLMGRAFRGG